MSAFLRKYATGTGADICIPLIKRGAVDFAVSADYTAATGDVKVSIDGGTAANISTPPVAIAMGNGAVWKFVFSNAELMGKSIVVMVADSATKAVEDQCFIIETYGHASAMYPTDYSVANTAQTGDSYARIGSAGAGLTALGDTRLANLDAAVSSRSSLTAAQVWDRLTSALTTSGSAGKLLVDNLNATVSSRSTLTAANVWDYLASAATTVGSLGKRLVDYVTGDTYSRLGAPAGASVSADIAALGTPLQAEDYTAPLDATATQAAANAALAAYGPNGSGAPERDDLGYVQNQIIAAIPAATDISDQLERDGGPLDTTADNAAAAATVAPLIEAGMFTEEALANAPSGGGGSSTFTLSQVAADVAAAVADTGALAIRRGDDFSAQLTGLGSLTGRVKLYVTIKEVVGSADAKALVQWEESGGLLYLNGNVADDPAQGSLTVNNASTGTITLTLLPAATAALGSALQCYYDVKVIREANVNADTLSESTVQITDFVTAAYS